MAGPVCLGSWACLVRARPESCRATGQVRFHSHSSSEWRPPYLVPLDSGDVLHGVLRAPPAPLQPLVPLPAAHSPWLAAPFLYLQNRKHPIALTFLLLSYLSVQVSHFEGSYLDWVHRIISSLNP